MTFLRPRTVKHTGFISIVTLMIAILSFSFPPVTAWSEEPVPVIHFFIVGDSLVADSVFRLDQVDFSAERLPFSSMFSSRRVESLTRSDFARTVAGSPEELIGSLPGIDLRSRGPLGVQADLSMRGGTFEQTMVMLDGVRINDPQSGHHNMDIPISMSDVERVEVLRGPGSTLYGPGAFSGVVNFITRRSGPSRVDISASGGEHGLYAYQGSGAFTQGLISHRFSAGTQGSDGYTENTDFETVNALYTARAAGSAGTLDLTAGWTETDFGANSFYTDMFPLQREKTETLFSSLSAHRSWKRISVQATVHARRHLDDFVLDHTRPDFYHNDHRADSYGGRFSAMFVSSAGLSTVSVDLNKEEINSSNLGTHDRMLGGMMIEQTFSELLGFSSTVTGNLYHHGEYGWRAWPGLSISRELGAGFRASGSADYSFRTPSFTELYYEDPANVSDPDLEPERAVMWETGVSYTSSELRGSVTVFQRYGYDLIDWVRVESIDPWHVQNYTSMTTSGVELDVAWTVPGDLFVEEIRAGFARNDNDRELGNRESKYSMTHLRTQGSLTVGMALPIEIGLWVTGRYNDRVEYDDYLTLDARITRTFWSVDVYIEGSNLTDTDYEEFVGVPTPGRWVRAGIKTGIEFD